MQNQNKIIQDNNLVEPLLIDNYYNHQKNFINQDQDAFFKNLTPLLSQISNLQRLVENDDIKPFIVKSTYIPYIINKIEQFYRANPDQKLSVFKILKFSTSKSFIIGGFFCFFFEFSNCIGLYFLDEITNELKIYDETKKASNSLILLFFLIMTYFFKSYCGSKFNWYQIRWKVECQASLQYTMFKKALQSKYYAYKEQNKEEDDQEQQQININNLMTVDIDEIDGLFWSIHTTWISIIQIIVLMIMLYYKLHDSIFSGIYIFIIAIIFNLIITGIMQILFKKMFQKKDERITLSSDVIDGIKSIKSLGWESIFEKKINEIRSQEFKYVFGVRGLDGVLALFWNSLAHFLLYIFLMAFVSQGHSLSDSNVFTIIALFNFLTYPIGILPWSIGNLFTINNSIIRINQFINQGETIQQINNNDNQNADTNNSSRNSFSSQQNGNILLSQAIAIQQYNFKWPNFKQDNKQLKKESALTKEQQINNFNLYINNLQINQGQITFVIGKIGSGKTALCQSILNEMSYQSIQNEIDIISKRQDSFSSLISQQDIEKFQMQSFIDASSFSQQQQQFKINGSLAYVSQNHWLQNKTIRDNILFYKEYNQQWYQQCIQVCQLDHDLQEFENGDMHIIGPGGGNLSGGQRQRISLCRAIYQNRDIYILDDVFSSLDVHVAEAIYKDAIQNLLVRQLKKTVIIVTSHYKYINDLNTKIIYIENGQIIQDNQICQQYLREQLQQEVQEEEQQQLKKQLQIQEEIEFDQDNQETDIDDNKEIELLQPILLKKNSSKNKSKQKKIKQYEEENQQNEEYRDQGNIKYETFLTYFKSCGITLLIFYIIFNTLMQSSSIFIDFWLRSQIRENDTSFNFINKLFHSNFSDTFTFLIAINLVITLIRVIFYVLCSQLAAKKIFLRLNKSIIYSKMTFFDTNSSGRIITRLSDDILTIDDELPWFLHVFLESSIESIALPIGIFIQFPWMIVFVVFSGGLIYIIQKIYRKSNRELKRLNSVNKGKLLTHINEVCKGLIIIRAHSQQQNIQKEYQEKLQDSINSTVISNSILSWMQVRLWLVSNVLLFLVAATCMIFLIFKIDFEYSVIAMTLTYSVLLSTSFSDAVNFFSGAEQRMISVERVRQYLLNDQENIDIVESKNQNNDQKNQNNKILNIDNKFSIIFENIYLTYDSKINKDQIQQSCSIQYALKNFSLQILKGEKIAFCGRTGSGKTSILNILFRLYSIQSGNIYINNTNIIDISLKQLRSQISVIPQFGFLYNASLKDNLDPNNSLTKEQVQCIISKSQLKIKDNEQSQLLDNQQQQDIDLIIEQSGGNLSNGEKQVVNFLRVMMQNRDIICLDEATSNMDPKTDQLLHEKLFEYTKNKTLLVITHRLENIDKYDRVVVLEKGEIVEIGHASELRKNKNGFFNKLLKTKLD